MKARKYPYNPAMLLAMILLCLTLISTYLTAGLYARYTSTGTGTDSARVAKFEVQESGVFVTNLEAEIAPGFDDNQSIVIENKSEVAVNCTVTLVNKYKNLPIKLMINGEENTASQALAPGATGTFPVVFEWPEEINYFGYMGMVDMIEVTLTAEQID